MLSKRRARKYKRMQNISRLDVDSDSVRFCFIHINADAMCHPHPMSYYASLTVNCSILDSTLAADGYRLAESKCVLEHYRAGNILHRTNRKMNSVVRGWLAKFSNNLENLFIPMWHWIPFLVGVGDRYLSFLIFYEWALRMGCRRQQTKWSCFFFPLWTKNGCRFTKYVHLALYKWVVSPGRRSDQWMCALRVHL